MPSLPRTVSRVSGVMDAADLIGSKGGVTPLRASELTPPLDLSDNRDLAFPGDQYPHSSLTQRPTCGDLGCVSSPFGARVMNLSCPLTAYSSARPPVHSLQIPATPFFSFIPSFLFQTFFTLLLSLFFLYVPASLLLLPPLTPPRHPPSSCGGSFTEDLVRPSEICGAEGVQAEAALPRSS